MVTNRVEAQEKHAEAATARQSFGRATQGLQSSATELHVTGRGSAAAGQRWHDEGQRRGTGRGFDDYGGAVDKLDGEGVDDWLLFFVPSIFFPLFSLFYWPVPSHPSLSSHVSLTILLSLGVFICVSVQKLFHGTEMRIKKKKKPKHIW
ncbi:hypothetical protein EUGRSUZ_H03962 [Eucalyptus grandis]|uniref:Uncharacterized protein n=2 Tax=Eucalyptus grandis TaxID=71139 RepID=A0ACC3JVA9_EUCGR|nr:hypothetical protein EUGRSUZ_H03962 [Eucalyptus grandis]